MKIEINRFTAILRINEKKLTANTSNTVFRSTNPQKNGWLCSCYNTTTTMKLPARGDYATYCEIAAMGWWCGVNGESSGGDGDDGNGGGAS